MADTLVDQVIVALLPLFRTALVPLDIPSSAVFDGRIVGSDVPNDYLTVGWTSENVPDISGTSVSVDNDNRAEVFDIRCEVSTLNGDNDMAKAMARAAAIRSKLGEAVRADRTLGTLLANGGYADIEGPFLWIRETVSAGAAVTGVFAVHVSVGWIS